MSCPKWIKRCLGLKSDTSDSTETSQWTTGSPTSSLGNLPAVSNPLRDSSTKAPSSGGNPPSEGGASPGSAPEGSPEASSLSSAHPSTPALSEDSTVGGSSGFSGDSGGSSFSDGSVWVSYPGGLNPGGVNPGAFAPPIPEEEYWDFGGGMPPVCEQGAYGIDQALLKLYEGLDDAGVQLLDFYNWQEKIAKMFSFQNWGTVEDTHTMVMHVVDNPIMMGAGVTSSMAFFAMCCWANLYPACHGEMMTRAYWKGITPGSDYMVWREKDIAQQLSDLGWGARNETFRMVVCVFENPLMRNATVESVVCAMSCWGNMHPACLAEMLKQSYWKGITPKNASKWGFVKSMGPSPVSSSESLISGIPLFTSSEIANVMSVRAARPKLIRTKEVIPVLRILPEVVGISPSGFTGLMSPSERYPGVVRDREASMFNSLGGQTTSSAPNMTSFGSKALVKSSAVSGQ